MADPVEELRVLLLEDTASDAELEEFELRKAGLAFTSLRVETREAFERALDEFKPDIVLADYRLPGYNGRDALEYACRTYPHIPVIMVTGAIGDESAVELLKLGARDYVLKSELARLPPAIRHALSEVRAIRNRELAEHKLQASELRYRRLFEAAKDGILILDFESGEIVDVNPYLIDLLSYNRDECIGKTLWEIGIFADKDLSKIKFKELQSRGNIRYENLPLKTEGGKRRDVEFVSNVYEVDGRKVIQCNIRDISERLLAAQALRDSESRYKRITEGLTDYQYTVRIVDGRAAGSAQSPSCVTVTGYAAEEFAANPYLWIHMVVPDDRDMVIARTRQVLSGVDVAPLEHRIIRKDGELRWVSDTIILFKDASGKLLSYDGVIRDITERKRANQIIQEEKNFSDSVIQGLPDIFCVLDRQGGILRWNSKLAELSGLAPAEIPGTNAMGFVHDEDRTYVTRKLQETFDTGAAVAEARLVLTNGVRFYYLTATRVETPRGINVICIGVDITERKLAETLLRESEETYRSLFENMLNGFAFCRMLFENGVPSDFIYLGVNKAFEAQTGLKDVVGKRVSEVIPGIREADPEIFERYGRVALGGKPEQFEVYVESLRAWFFVSVYSPRPEHFVAVFDAITERKRAEESLHRANHALKTLSAGNLALVRAANEVELLRMVTNVIVETGGYVMAWVGYAEHDAARSVRPVAQSGYEEGYLESANITWADTDRGRGPTGTAIRERVTVFNQDFLNNPKMAPWREDAIKRGYRSSIAIPLVRIDRVLGALTIYSADPMAFNAEEVRVLEELAGDLAFGIETMRTRAAHEQHAILLRQSLEQSIQTIAGTVEARDPYTAGHQRRVGELATAIARDMALPFEQVNGIHLAAIIHDLGKINIPAEILSKPGKLSELEYMLIKSHPQIGYDILKDVKFPWPIADIVLQHHEKIDGSGYPQGLKGGQILLESRIMTVADVVEAMSSHRPYRSALGIDAALREIERGRGTQYDPAVVDVCINLFTRKGFKFSS